ncbi:MAG: glycosyltransferase family 4 protein [Planctomycetota bacterium]
MRILHVTHEFPPYEFAGTAIYTYNIVKALANDHDVFVFSRLADKNQPDYTIVDENRSGYKVRLMNKPDLEWNPFEATYTDPKAEAIFTSYLDEVKPDLVHFQHILGMSYTCLEEVKKRKIAIVMTLHDFWTMCPMGQRMCYTDNSLCDDIDFAKCGPCCFGAEWTWDENAAKGKDTPAPGSKKPTFDQLFRHRYRYTPGVFARKPRAMAFAAGKVFGSMIGAKVDLPEPEVLSKNPFAVRTRKMIEALGHADLLITPSAFLRDEFIRIFGISPGRIVHSPNGMKFDHVTMHSRAASKVLRFGFMGSIIPTKGVHVLVEAAKKLKGIDGFKIDIFGAPNQWTVDYDKKIRKAAEGYDYITFKGRFDNKQVGKVLAEMDVLVVPSTWYENAPLTLNEAAMTKTPVLASDRGGMLEFVRDNEYGQTFELGNADDLAKKMLALIEDPTQVSKLSGREVYIKPVIDNARELEAIYGRLVKGQAHEAKNYVYRTKVNA